MSDGLIKVMNEEYKEIDDEAGRDKQIVGYIAGLVQKNYDKLTEVTGTDDGRKLYDFVEKALERVNDDVELYGESWAIKSVAKEAVLLGWLEVDGYSQRCNIADKLTDLGREVVEDYRKFKDSIGMTELPWDD